MQTLTSPAHEVASAEVTLNELIEPPRSMQLATCPGLEGAPNQHARLEQPALSSDSPVMRQLLDEHLLHEAWARVRDNEGAAGTDGQSLRQFASQLAVSLQMIKSEVSSGRYRPQPLLLVDIPKRSGGTRTLAIPAVRDRVLQTAMAMVIGPQLDASFDAASYGYRPGRSVAQAVAQLARWRDQGFQAVVDADIESFFDRIDHRLLMQMLDSRLGDPGALAMVDLWLAAVLRVPGAQPRLLTRGVPQGSPLSPLLANVYLDRFDTTMRGAGMNLVRYADDFVMLCKTADQAHSALALATQTLGELKLQLNLSKTRVTTFTQGFVFLGVRFHHNLMEPVEPDAGPWLLPRGTGSQTASAAASQTADAAENWAEAHDVAPVQACRTPSEPTAGLVLHSLDTSAEPDDDDLVNRLAVSAAADGVRIDPTPAALLQSLYVGEPGCWLTQEHDRVVVSRNHAVRASIPLGQLDQIAVLENAMVSTALLRRCAQRGVSVALAGHGGELLTLDRGRLADQNLLRAQCQAQDDAALHLLLARRMVEGKLHNCRVILRRFGRRNATPDVQAQLLEIHTAIKHLENRLDVATGLHIVRGLEGAAARRYFDGLRLVLPEGVHFPVRQKRPPPDPINLCLSLGYAVLANNLHTLVRLEGLNPHMGHLHTQAPGSLSLVSDLMEEFRAPVVDAVVVALWRQGDLTESDVQWNLPDSERPCQLQASARRRFIDALEQKQQTQMLHPEQKRAMDLRRIIQAQVRHYVRVLLRVDRVYRPFKLR